MKTNTASLLTTLSILSILFACNKAPVEETKNNKLVWAENVQSSLPFETDTIWDQSDLTNASNKFDRKKLISSITKAVLAGKIKAYRDFPNEELSAADVDHILVKWDSTAHIEDPEHPGTFISAPIKMEITSQNMPFIKFTEKIEFDTLDYSISKKVSLVSLYGYKCTETGATIGAMKLFDVKLN
jgi:hypothetical protein